MKQLDTTRVISFLDVKWKTGSSSRFSIRTAFSRDHNWLWFTLRRRRFYFNRKLAILWKLARSHPNVL